MSVEETEARLPGKKSRVKVRLGPDGIIRDFIVHERHHMAMEEREFFPAAVEALQPEDWAEIASSRLAGQKDPLSVRSSKRGLTLCEGISCSWSRRPRRNGRISDAAV